MTAEAYFAERHRSLVSLAWRSGSGNRDAKLPRSHDTGVEVEVQVLAIDPGPIESAYVVWDGERILEKGKVKNAWLEERVITEPPFPEFAIEMIASYGMAVGAETFETCVEIGRLELLLERYANKAHRVFRKDVKLHLCGSPRANDSNIRAALIDRLGAPGTKKSPGVTYGVSGDIWAALAVAVTWYDKQEEKHGK